jgi:hypothetical protein
LLGYYVPRSRRKTLLIPSQKEAKNMVEIRNSENKKIAEADPSLRTIEIARKGLITKIQFLDSGKMVITNSKA